MLFRYSSMEEISSKSYLRPTFDFPVWWISRRVLVGSVLIGMGMMIDLEVVADFFAFEPTPTPAPDECALKCRTD